MRPATSINDLMMLVPVVLASVIALSITFSLPSFDDFHELVLLATFAGLAWVTLGITLFTAYVRHGIEGERRTAAAAGALHRAQFDALMDEASDAVCVVDAHGTIRQASGNLTRILGRKDEPTEGLALRGLFPEDARVEIDDAIRRAFSSGHVDNFDVTLGPCVDEFGTVSVDATDGRGHSFDGVIVRVRDVSNERRAQVRLRESEARLRVLVSNSGDLIGIIRSDLRYGFVSPAVDKVVGRSAEQVYGMEVAATLHPSERDAVLRVIRALLDKPGGQAGPLRHRVGEEGNWTWFETIAVNRIDDPAVRGIVFNARDVTARQEAEAAVADLTQRLRALLHSMRGLVFMHDDNYTPLLVNQRFCDELLGGVESEAVLAMNGDDLAAVLTGQVMMDLEQSPEKWNSHITTGQEMIAQPWRLSDGRMFERDYRPIDLGRGRHAHLWVLHDVTEHERSREMLQMALRQAEEASAVKSDFVATVSHEIRNPMHGVLGLAEVLSTTRLDARQRELVDGIRGSAESLRGILDDILDMSKIEAGKMQIETVEFDIIEMLLVVKTAAVARATAKGIVFSLHVDPDLPSTVSGDPVRTRQVIANLVDNAIKFTDKGTVHVEVSKGLDAHDIRFQVVDTGIGIEKHRLQALFEPFEQASRATTRRYGGTGLGLAICAQLVRLMNGRIDVDSAIGIGTTFAAEIPLPAVRSHATLAPPVLAPASTGIWAGLRVLLAEDNAINQQVAVSFLQALGAVVTVANDGVEAVKAFRKHAFDVVLLDCEMPTMDGFEAVRQIRTLEWGQARTPVVALTANAMQANRERCLGAGMDDFLPKPFSAEALRSLLESLFGESDIDTFPTTAKSLDDVADLLNVDVMRELVDVGILQDVTTTFGHQLPERLAAIDEAFDSGEHSQLAAATHRLRSPAAALGLSMLATCCAAVEHDADSGAPVDRGAIDTIHDVARQSIEALRNEAFPHFSEA